MASGVTPARPEIARRAQTRARSARIAGLGAERYPRRVSPPPRLFVLLAQDAPVGIVLRRGPSAWARVSRWHTDTDALEHGAWFRGRLYEEKCDLSPDGALLVVAAFQGRRLGTETTDSWTAVSRAPWLHALALWPMGTTYGGGGRFVGPRTLVLRGASGTHAMHPADGLTIAPGNAPLQRSSGEVSEADWSGRDQRGRVVFTRAGGLYARVGERDDLVADFTGDVPDPQPPPAWATRPLDARNGGTRSPARRAR